MFKEFLEETIKQAFNPELNLFKVSVTRSLVILVTEMKNKTNLGKRGNVHVADKTIRFTKMTRCFIEN